MPKLVYLENVSCGYGQEPVVEKVSFSLAAGEIACLLGPSGCGKTTILRALAGFYPVLEGAIKLGENIISSPNFTQAPEKREMGMVFQDYALFPHLTVKDNIAFGLMGWSSADKTARVKELLQLVRLPDVLTRYPHELSGGQQQRVALARALAPRPKLLLMDEPFSNLDTDLRTALSLEVRKILKSQGIAAIVVTHDQKEAFAIGDTVGVLAQGRLQQWASPATLYHTPVSPLVADFVGKGELFEVSCVGLGVFESPELGRVEYPPSADLPALDEGQKVNLFLRPTDFTPTLDCDAVCRAVIESVEFLGDRTRYTLSLANGRQLISIPNQPVWFNVGDCVGVQISAQRPIHFAA
ncbi:MAG: ABC transporter ATP-binding protein [Pontibacterium sp.]